MGNVLSAMFIETLCGSLCRYDFEGNVGLRSLIWEDSR